jgi:hypothetical protein
MLPEVGAALRAVGGHGIMAPIHAYINIILGVLSSHSDIN